MQSINNTFVHSVGSFSGYIHRPKPYNSGMLSIFYGEDGEDADTITALSLTKFQDIKVLVKVNLIKDSIGKIMKDAKGEYPLICQYSSTIRRPTPTKGGMLANFFATNGDDADSVNELGKSRYQDSLVFIEVFSDTDIYTSEQDKKEIISKQKAEEKPTIKEKVAITKTAKKNNEAHKVLLVSGFYKNQTVWAVIGTPKDFEEWLFTKSKCYITDNGFNCENKDIKTINFKESNPFYQLNVCDKHSKKENVSGGEEYYLLKHNSLIQEWAIERIKANTYTPNDININPQTLVEYASKNNILQFVPKNYIAMMNSD